MHVDRVAMHVNRVTMHVDRVAMHMDQVAMHVDRVAMHMEAVQQNTGGATSQRAKAANRDVRRRVRGASNEEHLQRNGICGQHLLQSGIYIPYHTIPWYYM